MEREKRDETNPEIFLIREDIFGEGSEHIPRRKCIDADPFSSPLDRETFRHMLDSCAPPVSLQVLG